MFMPLLCLQAKSRTVQGIGRIRGACRKRGRRCCAMWAMVRACPQVRLSAFPFGPCKAKESPAPAPPARPSGRHLQRATTGALASVAAGPNSRFAAGQPQEALGRQALARTVSCLRPQISSVLRIRPTARPSISKLSPASTMMGLNSGFSGSNSMWLAWRRKRLTVTSSPRRATTI